jgi:hypothetical protein
VDVLECRVPLTLALPAKSGEWGRSGGAAAMRSCTWGCGQIGGGERFFDRTTAKTVDVD